MPNRYMTPEEMQPMVQMQLNNGVEVLWLFAPTEEQAAEGSMWQGFNREAYDEYHATDEQPWMMMTSPDGERETYLRLCPDHVFEDFLPLFFNKGSIK